MTDQELRNRLVARAVSGRYTGFLGVGLGATILGFILVLRALNGPDAVRVWQMLHVNWLFFSSLAFGSVALVAAYKTAHAKWAGLVTRFSAAAIGFVPVAIVAFVILFIWGYEPIYGHLHGELHVMSPGKQLWLSPGFMFWRTLIGLLVLGWVGWVLVRTDMLPDVVAARGAVSGGRRALYERWARPFEGAAGLLEVTERRVYWLGPLYIVTYAAVMTLVAFDLVMALQPHWFSNLFGGYYFVGAFLAAHMLLALLTLHGTGHLQLGALVSPKQRHDLGKMCFAFTVFWMYILWAQFLVIWYGNIPEETGFVFARLWGNWLPVGRWVFLGMFLIPFVGLLGVAPKKTRLTLGFFATVSLVAFWFERYLLVMPSVTPAPGPVFGLPEISSTLLFGGLFLLCYALFGRTFPMVSPRLAEITIRRELGHHHAADMYDHEEPQRDWVQEGSVERRDHPR